MISKPDSKGKTFKLPRQEMPGGYTTTRHPLVWLLENMLEGRSKRSLALEMGIAAQTLYGWERQARENPRTFLLPGTRARQIAEFFEVSPALLRPDLWG